MSEHDITQYVEGLAARVPVGEPPVPAIEEHAARTRRRRRTVGAMATAAAATAMVVAAAAVLSGGSHRSASEPVDRPSGTAQDLDDDLMLDGTWVVTGLVADDGSSAYHDPAGTGPVRLTFAGARLTGKTACNALDGRVEMNGRDLRLAGLRSTLVGCGEPPLVDRLEQVRHVSRDDSGTTFLHAENWMILVTLVPEAQTPEAMCGGRALAFGGSPGTAGGRPTPAAAAEPWLEDDDLVQVSVEAAGRRWMAVGPDGSAPTAVLVAGEGGDGWIITSSVACLDPAENSGCGPMVAVPDGTRYRLEGPDPAGTAIGVGRPVALGTVPACATFEIDGSTFGARGAVAPIGLFSANEVPVAEELTVTVGSGEVRRLHPVP